MTRLVLAVQTGEQFFGLASEFVREITPLGSLTRLPGAPAAVRGMQNLRGALVTVADLSAIVGGQGSQGGDGHVVVVEADGRSLGLLVDEVHEVYEEEIPSEHPTVEGAGPATVGGDPALVARVGHFGDAIVIEVNIPELIRHTLA